MLDRFLHWVLTTVATAAEAEMHDDTALREELLEAEMRRELGEISDEAFTAIEAGLLARMRDIAARRRGGRAGDDRETVALERSADGTFQVEASLTGDFHDVSDPVPGAVPAGAVVVAQPPRTARRPSPRAGRTAPGRHAQTRVPVAHGGARRDRGRDPGRRTRGAAANRGAAARIPRKSRP